ncbi:hypothetical protein BGZ63DRAFT_226029 [Mariannaea sp. PMI_226]|nr:hypothetical protein BGZ63DRAFT_226029 [Mariannaea sp. PMI_226]
MFSITTTIFCVSSISFLFLPHSLFEAFPHIGRLSMSSRVIHGIWQPHSVSTICCPRKDYWSPTFGLSNETNHTHTLSLARTRELCNIRVVHRSVYRLDPVCIVIIMIMIITPPAVDRPQLWPTRRFNLPRVQNKIRRHVHIPNST